MQEQSKQSTKTTLFSCVTEGGEFHLTLCASWIKAIIQLFSRKKRE